MTVPEIRVGYSPDADDAFMLAGLESGAVVARGVRPSFETADIETLNRRALQGDLDVTAVSFAAWPRLADRYDLLRVGSSFGMGYGPRLVAPRRVPLAELSGGVVAVPGELTTAALLTRLVLPGVRTRVVPFEEIPAHVVAGESTAGVVIHESQLTHESEGLALVLDLGEWWSEETGGLPVPLGANAIRRGLPPEAVEAFAEALTASILHGRSRRRQTVLEALRHGRGVDEATGDRFIEMYVNDLTLDPGPAGRSAVEELYRRAAAAGLLPETEARWVPGEAWRASAGAERARR